MFTASVDTNRLILMLDEMQAAMIGKGMDASNLVQDQTRLLARTITNFIPPVKAKGQKGSAKLNGEDAIEKDLCSLFSEARPKTIDEIGSIHGIKNIDTWLTQADGEKLHVKWDLLDPMGARLPEEHNANRGRYGTVKRVRRANDGVWRARVVVPQGTRTPYINSVKARVGTAKCSMALVGMRLGDSYPSWITRHVDDVIGGKAIVKIDLDKPAAPQVTFGSRAPGISRFKQRVQDAVNFRAKAMSRRIKLILSDYKDWRTVRAKANARKGRPSETPEAVE